MAVDRVSFGGWENNLRIANGRTELIITLDVGPRVISYRTADCTNVFKTFDTQLGGANESEWMPRGGHRFWLAPEDPVLSYWPDNDPVEHRVISDYEVETINQPTKQRPIRKIMTLALEPAASRVTVTHRAENHSHEALHLGTWGLSAMVPGGCEIIPLPRLGEHPRDLLPNRSMTLWPFTDMTDRRWRWGQRFIVLRQEEAGPTKLGLAHREGWIAYHRTDSLFLKTIEFREDAIYPDFGCNFETFANEEMLEVEALGPLTEVAPGGVTEHTERWDLFEGVSVPPRRDEEAMAWWIEPFLERAGLAGT